MAGIDLRAAVTAVADQSKPTASIQSSLQALAEASRDPSIRATLQPAFAGLLTRFNETTTALDSGLQTLLLRCIGNLISDNDANRDEIVRSGTLVRLGDCLPDMDARTRSPTSDIVVKVLFNAMKDHESSQREAFRQKIDLRIINYMALRAFSGEWEDADAELELTSDLLSMVVAHNQEEKREVDYRSDSMSDWVWRMLRVGSYKQHDIDSFLAVSHAVSEYLRSPQTLDCVLGEREIYALFDLINVSTEMAKDAENEEDRRLVALFHHVLQETLADIAARPEFQSGQSVDGSLMQMLYETCVPPPNRDPILSTTSCLMLGNFVTSDATANELLPRVPYREIFAMLGVSTNSAWTNAAAGLLRQLAQPAQSRKQLAADPEVLRASIGVYLNSAIADVQAAGLRLTRTLLRDQVDAVISFVTPDSERHGLQGLLTFYSTPSTTTPAVRAEVVMLMTSILRTLTKLSQSTPSHAALTSFTSTPEIADPFAFGAQFSEMPQIQSESWLALNLLARLPGGEAPVTGLFREGKLVEKLAGRIEEISAALQEHVRGKDEAEVNPAWVGERDNVVILALSLVRGGELGEEAKVRLGTALESAGVKA